jgi:hypothetical protein
MGSALANRMNAGGHYPIFYESSGNRKFALWRREPLGFPDRPHPLGEASR